MDPSKQSRLQLFYHSNPDPELNLPVLYEPISTMPRPIRPLPTMTRVGRIRTDQTHRKTCKRCRKYVLTCEGHPEVACDRCKQDHEPCDVSDDDSVAVLVHPPMPITTTAPPPAVAIAPSPSNSADLTPLAMTTGLSVSVHSPHQSCGLSAHDTLLASQSLGVSSPRMSTDPLLQTASSVSTRAAKPRRRQKKEPVARHAVVSSRNTAGATSALYPLPPLQSPFSAVAVAADLEHAAARKASRVLNAEREAARLGFRQIAPAAPTRVGPAALSTTSSGVSRSSRTSQIGNTSLAHASTGQRGAGTSSDHVADNYNVDRPPSSSTRPHPYRSSRAVRSRHADADVDYIEADLQWYAQQGKASEPGASPSSEHPTN